MGGPGHSFVLLFLALALTPQPGVSQWAHTFKYCNECKKYIPEKAMTQNLTRALIRRANYTVCPHNIIKFVLYKMVLCGDRIDSWVDRVTNCIDQGRDSCLPPTETKQDFSKGSKDEPPTTTQESTFTARTAPPLRLSTQTWKGGTLKPSETIIEELLETTIKLTTVAGGTLKPSETIREELPETTIRLTTVAADSNQNDLLQGNGPSGEKDDEKSKMKQMTIAIISLILIVLVMTAVGMYVWCRKTRSTGCQRHCTEGTVAYKPTPSEEP